MFNISSFLEKISKNMSSQDDFLKNISDIIFSKTKIICKEESIKIHNGILYLDISPSMKNKIFINKKSILEEIAHTTPKILDIR